jgi:hypothetical protein
MANANLPTTPSIHTVIASWVFGTLILLFCMGVFIFLPNVGELPEYKHKQLAIFSALLCALFTFFFVGSINVSLQIKYDWLKLGIQSCGSIGMFVFVLWYCVKWTPLSRQIMP